MEFSKTISIKQFKEANYMKKFWKVFLGAAAVAAVAPYRVEKDEETGVVQVKAALWNLSYTPGAEGNQINVRLLPGLTKKPECECETECCCDECAPTEEDEGSITIDVTEEPEETAGTEEPTEPAEPEITPEPEA